MSDNEQLMETDQHNLVSTLQDMVLESEDVRVFLDGLARVAAGTFSHGDDEVLCGVTLLRKHSAATVASSSDHARLMDEVQYGYDDGPCLRAAREGVTVHITDVRTETRFAEYRDAIARHGIRSALGVPIALEGAANSALDLYSVRPHAFDDTTIAAAEEFAREISSSLRLAVNMAQLSDDIAHRQRAMESRTTIDLAVGVIMAQNRCSQTEAMDILRRTSSGRNVKLRELAQEILTSINADAIHTHFD